MSGNYATGSSARRAAPASAATTRRQSASTIEEPAKSAYAERSFVRPWHVRLGLRRTTTGLTARRLGVTPLRFAMTSPPSGCQRDFHPQAVEHARHHNRKSPRLERGLFP